MNLRHSMSVAAAEPIAIEGDEGIRVSGLLQVHRRREPATC